MTVNLPVCINATSASIGADRAGVRRLVMCVDQMINVSLLPAAVTRVVYFLDPTQAAGWVG